jgi:ATP-dependent DNA helicase DinG
MENKGRALVLCTSWSFLKRVTQSLREPLQAKGIELLVQGEAPLRDLLDRKREEPKSVLVGTDSLWEGIDIPGEALTLVILTRFPFPVPSQPIAQARTEQIEKEGGSGFFDYSLPRAILKFRQGFGRLVRRGTDKGKIVILDPRILRKNYGRAFLDALPKCK